MRRRHVIRVIAEQGWILDCDGQKFGPYAGLDQAISTAQNWARNARQQGHVVKVVVHDNDHDGGGSSEPGSCAAA